MTIRGRATGVCLPGSKSARFRIGMRSRTRREKIPCSLARCTSIAASHFRDERDWSAGSATTHFGVRIGGRDAHGEIEWDGESLCPGVPSLIDKKEIASQTSATQSCRWQSCDRVFAKGSRGVRCSGADRKNEKQRCRASFVRKFGRSTVSTIVDGRRFDTENERERDHASASARHPTHERAVSRPHERRKRRRRQVRSRTYTQVYVCASPIYKWPRLTRRGRTCVEKFGRLRNSNTSTIAVTNDRRASPNCRADLRWSFSFGLSVTGGRALRIFGIWW